MQRTRVLVVFSSGEIGGAERSLTRMVLRAGGQDVEYHLATVGAGDAWVSWARQLGLEAEAYPVFGPAVARSRAIRRFLRDCRQLRPDVFYVVGMRCAALVRMLKPLLPPAVIVHAIRSTFPKGSALARRMQFSERLLGRLTDHWVANSGVGAESLARISGVSGSRIAVIRNGIDLPAVSAVEVKDKQPCIAVVANLNRYKGHIEFLRVVEMVRAAVRDVQVLFIGRDDSDGEVVREIERRGLAGVVRVAGFLESPEGLVAGARVFALPSKQIEGCPTAVLEAMALGVPVVAYAIGGVPELVESGKTGSLVPSGDSQAFADALIRLLTDDDMNARYSKAARETAARFSLAECAAQHDTLFIQLRSMAGRTE